MPKSNHDGLYLRQWVMVAQMVEKLCQKAEARSSDPINCKK